MKMQFKATSKAQSREIQDALFAAGYIWQGGQTEYFEIGDNNYIHTGVFSHMKMTYGFNENYYDEYVVVDGKIYKEGEEPKPVAEVAAEVRPPLGLRPKFLFEQEVTDLYKARLVEILEAVTRYAVAGKTIPDEWDNEYDSIREELNEHYSH